MSLYYLIIGAIAETAVLLSASQLLKSVLDHLCEPSYPSLFPSLFSEALTLIYAYIVARILPLGAGIS